MVTNEEGVSDGDKTARDFTRDRAKNVRAADWRQDGLWILVLSNGGRNFCAYIGIPVDHPLAGFDYELLPVTCNGGLTFAGEGDGEYRPEGYYWYGWDYAHSGDFNWWGDNEQPRADEKDWTLKEIKDDAWSAIYDMGKLKTLAERIYSKTKELT